MGGAEHVLTSLADALFERGNEVEIIYLTGPASVLPRNKEIKIIPLEMTSALDALGAYMKLRGHVKKYKPDVIHSHMLHANILARLLRLSTSIPRIVCTAHNTNEGGWLRMLAYRLTDRLADISTNVSDEAVEAFIKKRAAKPGRMISIPNGIDIGKFNFNKQARASTRINLGVGNSKMLLAVGRLVAQKDYPNLFKAILLVSKEKIDFKLYIVGDGELRNHLEALSRSMNLDSHIAFLGVRREIPQLMSAADAFVLSSEFEGFGLVVAEAMACERLVVATDCGGVAEVLGDTGYLVPPKSPQLLAEKIILALKTPRAEADILGEAARRRVIEKYSLESNINSYMKIYQP